MSVKYKDYYDLLGVKRGASPRGDIQGFQEVGPKVPPRTSIPVMQRPKINSKRPTRPTKCSKTLKSAKCMIRWAITGRRGRIFSRLQDTGTRISISIRRGGDLAVTLADSATFSSSFFGGGRSRSTPGTSWGGRFLKTCSARAGFAGGTGFTGGGQSRGQDVEAKLDLTLEEAYQGGNQVPESFRGRRAEPGP